ncbi:hypothetical protein ABMA27_003596 [Loxostege sticticalis]|uniref:Regulatory protein zeste n=1 Tax=Loxostege sticticalis TaxID=481309 RepID=A0ABR3HPK8_LOXSC
MEPRLRASPEQFSALIEFMERHGDLSRPQAGAQGRLRADRLWQELTSLLNSIGGGVEKTQDKWKKVWADWKTKTKKKFSLIRRHASGTGGGPSSRQTLTALEERVVAVIGVSAVVGQTSIQEQGFNTPSQPSEEPIVRSEGSEIQLILEVPNRLPASTLPTPPPVSATQPSQSQRSPPWYQPRTPPRSSERAASASPRSAAATPRRRLQMRARRNRGQTPFDRAASEFVAIEQRRLQLEEMRERHLHEREGERLRQESERIEVAREHNQLLRQLGVVAERIIDTLAHIRPSLPSTDILPDTE